MIIHACPQRMWYVNDFLIPELKRQGIHDIIVWNDTYGWGNLRSFINSCKFVKDCLGSGSTWHLQDDVLLSETFSERIKECGNNNVIYNGFCSKVDKHLVSKIGYQMFPNNWLSFQCTKIPNELMAEFPEWFEHVCIRNGSYSSYVSKGKYDDTLFWAFMSQCHKSFRCYNIVPNLVEHIDYLINGSIVNKQRKTMHVSAHWNEIDRIEQMKALITKRGDDYGSSTQGD